MQFYHEIITEKSFQFLQRLKKDYQFTLIGGWAVFLYSRSLKSKDIDIILDYSELGKIREAFKVTKNERLQKYEIKTGEFDVDIYVPDYSQLGIETGEILKSTAIKDGFLVPSLEILFLLKLYAYNSRRGSIKGQKDELDIFSLAILPEFNWENYKKLVIDYRFETFHELFLKLLKKTVSVPELDLNEQKFAKIKKKIYRDL